MSIEKAKFELSLQKDIRGEKEDIRGKASRGLQETIDIVSDNLSRLKETEEGIQNEEKIREYAAELGITDKALHEAFQDGLRFNVKAAYKIGFIDEKSKNADIDAVTGAYVLTFRSTLRQFVRDKGKDKEKVTPKEVLKIAKRMYLLSPRELQELQKKYEDDPDITDSVIKHFAIHNSIDPEGAIDKALAAIPELQKKYEDDPDMTDGVIKYFAVHNPTDPEGAIDKALAAIPELKEKYKDDPDITDGVIRDFAVRNPVDPEGAIDKALAAIPDLKEKYKDEPDITDGVIKRFVIGNPTDPDGAIDKALAAIPVGLTQT